MLALSASAEPYQIEIKGGLDANALGAWGPYSAIEFRYDLVEPGVDIGSHLRGTLTHYEQYSPLHIVDNDEVLFTGVFQVKGGVSDWQPNDVGTAYTVGEIEGVISPEFAKALGFGSSPINIMGLLDIQRCYKSDQTPKWTLSFNTSATLQTKGAHDVAAPEPSTVALIAIPLLAIVLVTRRHAVRPYRRSEPCGSVLRANASR